MTRKAANQLRPLMTGAVLSCDVRPLGRFVWVLMRIRNRAENTCVNGQHSLAMRRPTARREGLVMGLVRHVDLDRSK